MPIVGMVFTISPSDGGLAGGVQTEHKDALLLFVSEYLLEPFTHGDSDVVVVVDSFRRWR